SSSFLTTEKHFFVTDVGLPSKASLKPTPPPPLAGRFGRLQALPAAYGDRTPCFPDFPTTIVRRGYPPRASRPWCTERGRYSGSHGHEGCCRGPGSHGYNPKPDLRSSQP